MSIPLSLAAALAVLIAQAPAAPPPAFSAEQTRQLRCVAVLAIVAAEQDRRTAAALALPPLARDGARFAQIVGERVVADSGASQDQVRDRILAEVADVQAKATLPLAEAEACVPLMNALAPPPPPADPLRCAAALTLAAEDARRREGMTKPVMDLIAIASAVEDRARAELRAAGRSGAESDRELGLAREAVAAEPARAPYLEDCVELARP